VGIIMATGAAITMVTTGVINRVQGQVIGQGNVIVPRTIFIIIVIEELPVQVTTGPGNPEIMQVSVRAGLRTNQTTCTQTDKVMFINRAVMGTGSKDLTDLHHSNQTDRQIPSPGPHSNNS